MSTQNGNKLHTALILFGQDFEHNNGLRAQALDEWFGDSDDPPDCLNTMAYECEMALGEEAANAGLDVHIGFDNDEEALTEVHGSCYDLRIRYGHAKWLRSSLVAYAKIMRPGTDASAFADDLLTNARAAYVQVRNRQALDAFEPLVEDLKSLCQDAKHLAAKLNFAAFNLTHNITPAASP